MTDDNLHESWTTETGLLDDFAFTVTSSKFITDARYQGGEALLLEWEGTTDNPDSPEYSVRFPVGSEWESIDGGKTARHPKKSAFNKQSMYGRVIDRAIKDFNLGSVLGKRGPATQADVWVGLSFHMKMETIAYGGEIGDKDRLLPQAYLGEGESAGAAVEASAEATAEAPVASSNGTDKVLEAKVKALAKKSDSYDDFQAAALEIDGVTDDDGLLDRILDENGIWAEAQA